MAKEGEEHVVAKIAQRAIIEKDGKVLIVRNPDDREWEIPGGRLNKNELPEEGLVREIREEIGVEIIPQGIVFVNMFVHKIEGDHLNVIYWANLADPEKSLVFEEAEVAEVRWITPAELHTQPIWDDNREALEIFFKMRDK